MTQDNLSFGDSTAHATVEWFLDQLTGSDSIFTENFDNFCKALNAVRFIDCLREQINKDKYLFTLIEGIAGKLDEGDKFQKYPNLSVLLLSIAQKSLLNLSGVVKQRKLYNIGEKLYDHFKNNPNSPPDACDVALKAGFQLSKFQNNLDWKREFAAFKEQHYERLTYLRRQYFSTDNPTTFSHRVVERYKLIYGTSGSENSDSEFIKLVQEFEELDPESSFLHPLCLQLPILARSTKSISFADDFAKNLRDGESDKEFSESLAQKFRILQWNILVRDLVEEDRSGTSLFYPITEKPNIQGVPSREEFLIKFFEKTRLVEYHFSPAEGEIPTEQRADVPSIELPILKTAMGECYASFQALLPKVRDFHPLVHKDLVDSFAKMRKEGNTSNAVLIEDGELSFFSMLWLLRYAASEVGQLTVLESNPDTTLTTSFRPRRDKSRDDWWTTQDMCAFVEECGFIIRLSNKECILTCRWRSLITWLRRLNRELNKSEDVQLPIVKNLDYSEAEKLFTKNLSEFLTSPALKNTLDKVDVFSHVPMICKDFVEKEFGPLMKSLGSLLDVESAGLDDTILFRCCRAGFIPLEHLFRAYWPCEFHLLIQALNWEESKNSDLAPISLGFATIAGRVETDQNSKGDLENLQKGTTDFDHWLVPYRTLFSALSANLTLSVVKEDSEQIGTRGQQKHFAHQTAGLLDTLWVDPKRNGLNSESQVALWLAKTQITDVWGGFPLNTETHIGMDFPEWMDLSKINVIDKLSDLGLHGGVMRASKSEIEAFQEFAWDLGAKLRNDEPKAIEKTFDEVRAKLLFPYLSGNPSNPDIPLPEWVTTKAFAICFFHGMRQAAYHALETWIIFKQKGIPHLRITWDNQSVSIYNRGVVKQEHRNGDIVPKDRYFFNIFMERTNDYCSSRGIDEKFKIDGPKPINTSDDEWRLVIKKE
ncbi:MAG: hypothetical protein OXH00_05870 [Candidatus Poribacteria bacterium]|nr:hypothetical protein [Candidatus Poribacteria bacterium]